MGNGEDSRAAGTPPVVIWACVAIFAASVVACIMDRFSAAVAGRSYPRDALVIAVVTALVIWGLARRQNWLRVLICAVYLVAALVVMAEITVAGVSSVQPLIILHSAIQLIAAVLLAQPESSAWFRQ